MPNVIGPDLTASNRPLPRTANRSARRIWATRSGDGGHADCDPPRSVRGDERLVRERAGADRYGGGRLRERDAASGDDRQHRSDHRERDVRATDLAREVEERIRRATGGHSGSCSRGARGAAARSAAAAGGAGSPYSAREHRGHRPHAAGAFDAGRTSRGGQHRLAGAGTVGMKGPEPVGREEEVKADSAVPAYSYIAAIPRRRPGLRIWVDSGPSRARPPTAR